MSEQAENQRFEDNRSIVQFLKKSRLLNPIGENLLAQLAPLFKIVHIPSNTEICTSKDCSDQIFFLIKGKIAIYSNGNLIFKLKRTGDMFGDMSFITQKSCTTSEIADTPVDLFSLKISDIFDRSDIDMSVIKKTMYQLFTSMLMDQLTMCCSRATDNLNAADELKGLEQLLSETKKELEKANKVKSDFLANVSHEIRTPMHGVLGMTSLLMNTELSPQQMEFAKTIDRSASAFLNVINDILDFSKLDKGEVEFQEGPFELQQLLNKAVEDLSARAKDKKLKMNTGVSQKIPLLLRGDSTRIHQILINLIGNAVKFTDEGRVSVFVDLIKEEGDDIQLRFEVKDTGIGISPEDSKHLFKSFSQADPSLTRIYGGTGLGLVISKQLVEAMGGEIGFKSTEGVGSLFWFSLGLKKQIDRRSKFSADLPYNRSFTRLTDKTKKLQIQEKKKTKILLAGSDKINQIIVLLTLEKLGYGATIAENEAQTISLLENQSFDVLMIDSKMADTDAFKVTRKIRNSGSLDRNKGIPVICLMTKILGNDRANYLKEGMNDFLVKPVSDTDLDMVLQRWISIRKEDRKDSKGPSFSIDNCVDLNMIDRLKRSIGEIDSLIHLFLKEIPEKLKEMDEAIKNSNSRQLEHSAHTLKSNCVTFGALTMADICVELEQLGSRRTLNSARKLYLELKKQSVSVTEFFEHQVLSRGI